MRCLLLLRTLLFFCFAKKKSKQKKRRFFAQGSAGKKRLDAGFALLRSAEWRWFCAYRLLLWGFGKLVGGVEAFSFGLSSLRRKKAPLGAGLGIAIEL
ncbi:MAG: hypothetical protein V4649_12960 [Bacteroidota bacterium]